MRARCTSHARLCGDVNGDSDSVHATRSSGAARRGSSSTGEVAAGAGAKCGGSTAAVVAEETATAARLVGEAGRRRIEGGKNARGETSSHRIRSGVR